MFEFLNPEPFTPPTERQLKYAKRLGVVVSAEMSKSDVSEAIDFAISQNPAEQKRLADYQLKQRAALDKERLEEFGSELVAAETSWIEFADSTRFMLAIYRRGKSTIVDILEVYDADIVEVRKKPTLKLRVLAPKLVKDRWIGEYLEWEKEFELPIHNLLWCEALSPDFHELGLETHQHAIERGLEIARSHVCPID